MTAIGYRLSAIVLAGCGRGFFDPQQPCDAGDGSAGPPIVFRQANSTVTTTNAMSLGVPLPLTIVDGDVLVLVVGFATPSAVSSVTDNLGNAYMGVIGPTQTTGSWSQQMFIARSTGGAPGAITVMVSFTTAVPARLAVAEYGNIDAVDPVEMSVGKIGASSSTVTPGSFTTVHAHDLIFVAGTSDGSLSGAMPNFMVRESAGDYVIQDKEVTTATGYGPVAPAGTNSNWIMQMVALRGL